MTIATQIQALNDGLLDAYNAVSAKGGTVPTAKNLDNLPTAIGSISGGSTEVLVEKDVNFYDYDGALVHAYTAEEFDELDAMPASPDHSDLGLSTGLANWTLADAKDYVSTYGGLDIGYTYIPTDEKTHVFVNISNDKDIKIQTDVTGTGVSVDWGDGSDIEYFTPGTQAKLTHTYADNGKYEILIDCDDSSKYNFEGSTSGSWFIMGGGSATPSYFRNTIEGIFLAPKGISAIDSYAFYNCRGLQFITIPDNRAGRDSWITTLKISAFYNCSSLKAIVLPAGFNKIASNNTFQDCINLEVACMPKSLTELGIYCFQGCLALKSITIPNNASLTSIPNQCFMSCRHCRRVIIPNNITSVLGSAFAHIDSSKEIIIPDSVTSISSYSFQDLLLSERIRISKKITAIPTYAFSGAMLVREIDMSDIEAVPTVASNGLGTIHTNRPVVKVPTALLSDFQAATQWSNYADLFVGV